MTGWWSSYWPYEVDPGWEVRKNTAKCFGVSIRELGRVTSAITESWNNCDFLIVIKLKFPIVAAYGRYTKQLRYDGNPIRKYSEEHHNGPIRAEGKGHTRYLPGGGWQFYVPNLKPEYFTIERVESLLSQ